jgi:protein ImuA
VRNDVPGGAEGLLVPPAGVARAGGTTGRVLIEQLRASIRALEQVPVSLGLPPAPGPGPSRPACSSLSPKLSPPGLTGRSSNPRLEALPQPTNQGRELLDARLRGHDEKREERKFPLTKLTQAGLHEIRSASYRDTPAALGFALAAITKILTERGRRNLLLWCLTQEAAREWGHPYGPGLIALGLDPARLLLVEARTMHDAAWALEEALKSFTLVAALGQAESVAELAARRLGLAAQASATPCLLISGHRHQRLPGTLTSWRIAARGSAIASFDDAAPGRAAWHVTLERCRGAAPGQSLIVEFSHESDGFHLSAASSARAAEASRQSSYR